MKKIAAILILNCAALSMIGMAYNAAVPDNSTIKTVPLKYEILAQK